MPSLQPLGKSFIKPWHITPLHKVQMSAIPAGILVPPEIKPKTPFGPVPVWSSACTPLVLTAAWHGRVTRNGGKIIVVQCCPRFFSLSGVSRPWTLLCTKAKSLVVQLEIWERQMVEYAAIQQILFLGCWVNVHWGSRHGHRHRSCHRGRMSFSHNY